MTRTTIRIGRIAIDNAGRAPMDARTFGARIEGALAEALRRPAQSGRARESLTMPVMRLTLRRNATDADVAHAVADAVRRLVARGR